MKRIFLFVAGLLALHLFLLVNLQFTAWPEMFSYPYLFNNGFTLYKDFIYPYPPLLTVFLAGIYKLFGYHLEVLKTVTWTLVLSSDLFVFLVVKKLTGKDIFALLSLIFYIFLQPTLEGNMLWFDVAIVLPLLAATYSLILARSDRTLFFAGLSLAVAMMIKQTSGLCLIAAILYLVYSKTRARQLLWFLVGPVLAGALLLIELAKDNVLQDFINWAFLYPFAFWSKFPGYVQMTPNRSQLITLGILLLPLVILLAASGRKFVNDKKLVLLILLFLAAGFGIYPRFSFFHFQPVLTFIIISAFYLFSKTKLLPIISFLYLFVLLARISFPAISRDWNKETRFYGSGDLVMAQAISKIVPATSKVFLLGQYSSLYVLADRLPPRPWVDNFGWYLEVPGVQESIINRWNDNRPGYIFWAPPGQGNWFDLGVYQPKIITAWIQENYVRIAEVQPNVWLWRIK